MFTNQETQQLTATAEVPPAAALTPEAVVEGLRALRAQIAEETPLTPVQRKALRRRVTASEPVLQASINVIGALDNVAHAIGKPAGEVRQLAEEANRWTAVEDELRSMLSGVVGANLLRRQRVALAAAQAVSIGAQLARDPEHAVLVPHVQEIKRLKSFKRRKKTAEAPATPESPASGHPTVPGTSVTPKA